MGRPQGGQRSEVGPESLNELAEELRKDDEASTTDDDNPAAGQGGSA